MGLSMPRTSPPRWWEPAISTAVPTWGRPGRRQRGAQLGVDGWGVADEPPGPDAARSTGCGARAGTAAWARCSPRTWWPSLAMSVSTTHGRPRQHSSMSTCKASCADRLGRNPKLRHPHVGLEDQLDGARSSPPPARSGHEPKGIETASAPPQAHNVRRLRGLLLQATSASDAASRCMPLTSHQPPKKGRWCAGGPRPPGTPYYRVKRDGRFHRNVRTTWGHLGSLKRWALSWPT